MVLTAIVVWRHRPAIAAGTVALSMIVAVGFRWDREFGTAWVIAEPVGCAALVLVAVLAGRYARARHPVTRSAAVVRP